MAKRLSECDFAVNHSTFRQKCRFVHLTTTFSMQQIQHESSNSYAIELTTFKVHVYSLDEVLMA